MHAMLRGHNCFLIFMREDLQAMSCEVLVLSQEGDFLAFLHAFVTTLIPLQGLF